MKTAEEWTYVELNDESNHQEWIDFIEQIQLNALKAGELIAANVVESLKLRMKAGELITAEHIKQAILADAANRTELP